MINWIQQNFEYNPYSLPFLFSALFVIFIGTYVMIYGAHIKQRFSFLGFSVSFFFWLIGTFFVYTAQNAEMAQRSLYLTYLGVTLISPSLYCYASVWLGREQKNKLRIILSFLLGIPIMAVIAQTDWIMYGAQKYYWGYHSRLTVAGGIVYLIYFLSVAVMFFATLYQGFREETDPVKKRQIKLVGIAFLLAYLGSSDFMPCYGIEVFPIGGLTMVGACGALAYTIIRYKLLDIETVIHKTIMWLATSTILGAPLVLFFYTQKDWVYELPTPAYLALLVTSFLLVVLYGRNVQPHIDHFFQRKQANLNRALEVFSDQLVHLIDLKQVVEHILVTLKKVLYVKHASVLIRLGNTNDFSAMSLVNLNKSGKQTINADLVRCLEESDKVLLRDFIQGDPGFERVRSETLEYFQEIEATICVPLVVNRKLIGILNLGQKQNLQSFRSAERVFIADFRRNSAIALSNALQMIAIQENLKRWNEELERKVEERTEQLKETQAQLVQAEKLATIGTLAGGVAHEINNPLTAVLTNAQILRMSANAEDVESIELIEEGAKRCQIIIKSLLKYSRKSEADIPSADVSLNRVVETAFSFLDYQLQQENIEVVRELKEVPPIKAISNELEQVITNLLVNAKDAVGEVDRKAKIILKTYSKGRGAIFEISDNGKGIPENIRNKIFDPFFTTKDVGGGTGLGLAVTQSILQKHQADIHVDSKEGVGTTFSIWFPLQSVQGDEADASTGGSKNLQ